MRKKNFSMIIMPFPPPQPPQFLKKSWKRSCYIIFSLPKRFHLRSYGRCSEIRVIKICSDFFLTFQQIIYDKSWKFCRKKEDKAEAKLSRLGGGGIRAFFSSNVSSRTYMYNNIVLINSFHFVYSATSPPPSPHWNNE